MAGKQGGKNTPYSGERDTKPHCETGDTNFRHNNAYVSTPTAEVPDAEGASDAAPGDPAVNDRKLTHFTANHSAEA